MQKRAVLVASSVEFLARTLGSEELAAHDATPVQAYLPTNQEPTGAEPKHTKFVRMRDTTWRRQLVFF